MSIFLRHFYRTRRNMLFSEPVLFEIPVRPRIKKFIAVKLQDADGRPQPLVVGPTCEGAGLFLWAMAQSEKVLLQVGWRRQGKLPVGICDASGRIIAPVDMTQRLGFGINGFHKSRQQYLLNYAELETFCNFVDYIILNELMCFCQEAPTDAIMPRVKAFCDLYDFSDDEMSEFALKQKVWRNRTQSPSFNYDVNLTKVRHFQPVAYGLAA